MNNEQPDGTSKASRPLSRRMAWAAFRLLILAVILFVVGTSFVMVDEREYVLVERLGHIIAVYDRAEDRGLHFKCPWPIDVVRRFDARVQLFDPPGREVFTRDKKNITVDTYVCWKIAGPRPGTPAPFSDRPVVRFFRSLGTIDIAEARLDTRVRSILSTRVGQVELSNLLKAESSETGPGFPEASLLEQISDTVRREVAQRPGESADVRDRLGIEIVDVRVKRLNLPVGNQQAVFERMKSERKKIADRYRSAGIAENTVIKSQADRQYGEILAHADADAKRIRGEAEAEAITILNRAHAQDPEFYKFLRTLDTYKTIISEKTTLVLSASSSLLKLLTQGIPDEVAPQMAPPDGEKPGYSPGQPVSQANGIEDKPAGAIGATASGGGRFQGAIGKDEP